MQFIELRNAIMAEYTALVGIGHRFGTPWRPMEQGLVESKHKETQKVMGMLVNDIMQCFPNEVGELHHVVEFIVYNTPGPHGFQTAAHRACETRFGVDDSITILST